MANPPSQLIVELLILVLIGAVMFAAAHYGAPVFARWVRKRNYYIIKVSGRTYTLPVEHTKEQLWELRTRMREDDGFTREAQDRLRALCDEYNPDDVEGFRAILALVPPSYDKGLAEEFEAATLTLGRWRTGVATPLRGMRSYVVGAIRRMFPPPKEAE